MRMLFGALAAVSLLVGIGAAQPASARCFWNGFATQCYHHPYHHWGWRHHDYRRGWDRY